jgi:exosortase family protein XrtF
MLKIYFKNPFVLFFIKAIGFYILWYLIYELWLHPQGRLDLFVIDQIILLSSRILSSLGFTLIDFPYDSHTRSIGIDGTHGLWVGDPCNGLTLFALFSGFILAFPGSIKHKLWFIPLGILSIHLLNVLRVVALTTVQFYFPDWVDFNHTYTFTILVYSYVFLLWMIWVNKFYKKDDSLSTI